MKMDYDIQSINSAASLDFTNIYFSLWLILSGDGDLSANNGQSISVQPLDLIRLCPGECYQYTAKSHTLIGVIKITDFYSTQSEFSLIRSGDNEQVKKAFLFALDMQGTISLNKKPIMNSLADLIWNILVGLGLKHNSVNPLIGHMISIIRDNHQDPEFNLSALIEKTGYSPGHLRRIFKDQTGLPPLEFLTRMRIDTAKKYMREASEKLTVKDISNQCGFNDPNFFSKQFKNKEGLSPQEYINQFRQV